MKIHSAKLLTAIQYVGEEPKECRELGINPIPVVEKGDLLIVPENVGKFLSREGSPYERIDLDTFLKNSNDDKYINQISDDAVAKVNQLNQTILELEAQLKIKNDDIEAIELRENQEMEELKKLNEELNEKLENLSKPKKTTTKAPKEETL